LIREPLCAPPKPGPLRHVDIQSVGVAEALSEDHICESAYAVVPVAVQVYLLYIGKLFASANRPVWDFAAVQNYGNEPYPIRRAEAKLFDSQRELFMSMGALTFVVCSREARDEEGAFPNSLFNSFWSSGAGLNVLAIEPDFYAGVFEVVG
jgi:hypothetical protein